jgi:hypothetical protein
MLVEYQVSFWNPKFHFGIPILKFLPPKLRDFSRTLEIRNVLVPQVADARIAFLGQKLPLLSVQLNLPSRVILSCVRDNTYNIKYLERTLNSKLGRELSP